MRAVGWAFAAFASGCTCGSPAPERSPPGHFEGWSRLLDAAARGDREAARQEARDLYAPDVDDPELGAALGVLQIAEDEELEEALAAAAAACDACHRDLGVGPPGGVRPTQGPPGPREIR